MSIIEKLYKEALELNPNLNEINNKINEIQEVKTDSLEEFYTYLNNNDIYFETVNRYLKKLNDNTLRKNTKVFFDKLELNYRKKTSNQQSKIAQINELSKQLEDQIILMKLFVTNKMISNYQTNEKPDIEKIEFLIQQYKKLIKEVKENTKK